jgi:hypothetical protein
MNNFDKSPSISVEEKYQCKTEVDNVSTVAVCTPLIRAPQSGNKSLLLICIVQITSDGSHKKETPALIK